jgi:hypothetical protein
MTRPWSIFFTAISIGASVPAMAASAPVIPAAVVPAVQCIHRVLKSSSAVQSVSLYSVDGFRFAAEYVFRNKENQAVVSDIEFYELEGSVMESDKIPREISAETADEGQKLEEKLELVSKCHLDQAFDNLLPQPKARADWQKFDLAESMKLGL